MGLLDDFLVGDFQGDGHRLLRRVLFQNTLLDNLWNFKGSQTTGFLARQQASHAIGNHENAMRQIDVESVLILGTLSGLRVSGGCHLQQMHENLRINFAILNITANMRQFVPQPWLKPATGGA